MVDLERILLAGAEAWLCPDQLFDGTSLSRGMALGVAGGKITGLSPRRDLDAGLACIPVPGIIAPGFFDIQINGGGGVMFNADQSAAGLARIAAAHRQTGTMHWLPTVLTDRPEILGRAADAILGLHGADGIAGIHIEGPHISEARRGTHATAFIRPFDATTLAHIARLRAQDVPVLITLAPEAATPEDVAAVTALGAVVSIGHSGASADAARALLDAGAGAFTHLFNAMPPMLNRAPGIVGAAINSDVFCSIIVDGHHVADEVVGLAVRARPLPGRMIAITDAMATVGGPDHFNLYGADIHLADGKLVNAEGSLAGAHTTLLATLSRLVGRVGVPLETALGMITAAPAALMGLDPRIGHLVPGNAAEFVRIAPDLSDLDVISGVSGQSLR